MNLFLVILPFLGGFGLGDYSFFGSGYGFRGDSPSLLGELNLTQEQKQIVHELQLEHREKMIDLRANMQKASLNLKAILLKESFDEKEVFDAIENLSKAQTNMLKEKTSFFLNLKKVLPKEKWEILRNLIFEKWQGKGPRWERPSRPRR